MNNISFGAFLSMIPRRSVAYYSIRFNKMPLSQHRAIRGYFFLRLFPLSGHLKKRVRRIRGDFPLFVTKFLRKVSKICVKLCLG